MKLQKKIIVDSSGLCVSLEYATIGGGAPKTLVISGIHGDERSGQLVIAKLLQNLPNFVGTLTVLPVANPLAYAVKRRNEPISGQDLNRSFTGKNDGRPLFQTAEAIVNLAKEYDYVIDLHGYTTAGLIQAGISDSGSAKMAEILNPDVLRIAHISQAHKIEGTLPAALKNIETSYMLIELPTDKRITQDQINRVATGLKAHLQKCNQYDLTQPSIIISKPFVRVKLLKAPQSGVFERAASLKLGEIVKEHDELGTLFLLPSQEKIIIRSQHSGVMCEMEEDGQLVTAAGETLFGIGELLSKEEKEQFLGSAK